MVKIALSALLLTALPRLAAAQLYDVRPGPVSHERRERPALKVQVDGPAADTRQYFQQWMKDSYKVRFKGGGVAGIGKSNTLSARQASVVTISGKPIDLYATIGVLTDSTAEVAVFGGFDENTFFDEQRHPTEFGALRNLVRGFGSAARLRAYRADVEAAEKRVREAGREKEKLERSTAQRRASTVSNLRRIEELKKENIDNRQRVSQDSVQLLQNADLRQLSERQLQLRRARLSTLDRQN